MSEELKALLEAAKSNGMSANQAEEQRISFAYGNTHFENDRITKEIVSKAAKTLNAHNAQDRHSKR